MALFIFCVLICSFLSFHCTNPSAVANALFVACVCLLCGRGRACDEMGVSLYLCERSGLLRHGTPWTTYSFGCCMAGTTWTCCRLGASSVYTMHQFTVSLHLKPHWLGAVCLAAPALVAEWPGSWTCYSDNTGVERIPLIRVGTESWSWRRENSPAAPAWTRTLDLSTTSPAI